MGHKRNRNKGGLTYREKVLLRKEIFLEVLKNHRTLGINISLTGTTNVFMDYILYNKVPPKKQE